MIGNRPTPAGGKNGRVEKPDRVVRILPRMQGCNSRWWLTRRSPRRSVAFFYSMRRSASTPGEKKKKRETGFRVWSREWGPALVPYGGRSTTGISENAALRTSRWWETFRTHLSLFKEKNYSTITAVGGRLVETGFWVWSSFSTTSPEYSSVSLLTVESDQRGAAFRTA